MCRAVIAIGMLPQHHCQMLSQHRRQMLSQHHTQMLSQHRRQMLSQHYTQMLSQHRRQILSKHSNAAQMLLSWMLSQHRYIQKTDAIPVSMRALCQSKRQQTPFFLHRSAQPLHQFIGSPHMKAGKRSCLSAQILGSWSNAALSQRMNISYPSLK